MNQRQNKEGLRIEIFVVMSVSSGRLGIIISPLRNRQMILRRKEWSDGKVWILSDPCCVPDRHFTCIRKERGEKNPGNLENRSKQTVRKHFCDLLKSENNLVALNIPGERIGLHQGNIQKQE
jgi:hypothetical protein